MVEAQKTEVLKSLQASIHKLQGYRGPKKSVSGDSLGPIRSAFPNQAFPIGAVHEFICSGAEGTAATTGFIAAVLTSLMKRGGVSVWISSSQTVFPAALKSFMVDPHKIVFIHLKKEKDVMWAMNEALRCESLTAVIAEMNGLDFKSSRRLQLAVEQSMVTGFVLRSNPRVSKNSSLKQSPTACVSRWAITPLPGQSVGDDLPGLGYPRWNVELMKIRNGKPGVWQLAWEHGHFRLAGEVIARVEDQQRKAG